MNRFILAATVALLLLGGCANDPGGGGGGTDGSGTNPNPPATPPPTPPSAPTVTILADPTSVAYNGTSAISWTSANATVCSLKDTGGAEVANGTSGTYTTPALTAQTTYMAMCTGDGGIVLQNVVILVGSQPQPAPTVTVTTNKNPAPYGGPMRVSATSTDAEWCSLKDGTGTEVATGTDIAYTTPDLFGETASYTATCGNATGTATVSVTVPVQPMVEVTIGTVWGLNIDNELGVFFLVRYWPKQNPISYYEENGIQVTITSGNAPSWPGQETVISHPDSTDNTDLVFFKANDQGSVNWPNDLAMTYRVQLTFEGQVVDRMFSLDTVVVPHALPWHSILPTVYSDHITVSFTEAPASYGYKEYVPRVSGGAGNFCNVTLGYVRGPHSPLTVPVGKDGFFDCLYLYGQNWASEPTSSSVISVKKADPLPSYPLFSIGGIGLGF